MKTKLFTPMVVAALMMLALEPPALRAAIAQQVYLKASNTEEGDEFGVSVAVSGNTVVVGAWIESSSATGVDGDQSDNSAHGAGAAYIFVRDGTTWTQQAYLKASNTDGPLPDEYNGDLFGRSVAISGDTVVVGAYSEDSSATGVDGDGSDNSALYAGAAYVFVRSGTNWTQQAYLKAPNTEAYDYFGLSVAVSGDTVVASGGGAAHVICAQRNNLDPAGLSAFGWFGIGGLSHFS